MPEDFKPVILPLRREIPHIGEDVYAIGAPLSEKDLQDTVTKGIVSAWRPSDRITRQSYIQADVDVQPGNSGGPLLDAHGNILGLTVAGDDGKAAMRQFGRAVGPRAFGASGLGGQIAWADPDSGLSFCFLTNGLERDQVAAFIRANKLSTYAARCV